MVLSYLYGFLLKLGVGGVRELGEHPFPAQLSATVVSPGMG